MEKLGRLVTAMVTPFDVHGGVNYAQAKRLALGLLDCGSDGLVVSGTTGESPTLSKSEKLRLFAEVKEAVGHRGWVIAGTGGNDTAASRELTKEAEKLGVDACLLVVPYYNKPSQEGLFQHFKSIAESTSLPCIVYNVPARTVTSMSAETTIKLSQIGNIIGTKEASSNLEQIAQIIQGARPGFLVWSGNDADTLPILSLGGYGIISVASHLVGKQMKEMMDQYLQGRTEEAAALHRRLLPLFNALFVVSNPVPVKYALNKVGVDVGKPRLPLVEPDAKSAATIEAAIKASKIDVPLHAS
jgi:4-hydroxy-tetrahydrodipicolinate synthase